MMESGSDLQLAFKLHVLPLHYEHVHIKGQEPRESLSATQVPLNNYTNDIR